MGQAPGENRTVFRKTKRFRPAAGVAQRLYNGSPLPITAGGAQKERRESMNKRRCPICGREYSDHPAISRADNETEICPDCGSRQALEAAGLAENVQNEILQAIREAKEGSQ